MQELAAVVIARLSRSNPNVALTVAEAGGIAPLVNLVRNGSTAAQQQAAGALAEVGLAPANRDAIAEAGGIEPLVKLLTSRVVGSAETAARALAHLARDARDTPDDGGAPPETPADEATAASVAAAARLAAQGTLVLTLHKGMKLATEAHEGAGGTSPDPSGEPHVRVSVGGQALRSKPAANALDPVWGEELRMQGALHEFLSRGGLSLQVFESEAVNADDQPHLLGDACVPLDFLTDVSLSADHTHELNVPLR